MAILKCTRSCSLVVVCNWNSIDFIFNPLTPPPLILPLSCYKFVFVSVPPCTIELVSSHLNGRKRSKRKKQQRAVKKTRRIEFLIKICKFYIFLHTFLRDMIYAKWEMSRRMGGGWWFIFLWITPWIKNMCRIITFIKDKYMCIS